MTLVTNVSWLLSFLTLIGDILILIFLLTLIFSKNKFIKLKNFIGNNALFFAFIVSFIATSGSLFYSDIAKYDPCKLCWFQRIFMYPQVLLLGIAMFKKDHKISDYILPMSIIGALIASYRYMVQLELFAPPSCSAVGCSVSCATKFVMSYGYITIPMMSLTAFILIIICMLCLRYKK